MRASLLPALLIAAPLLGASPTPAAAREPLGRWHAALVPSEGREVFFDLELTRKGPGLAATLWNGAVKAPFTSASWENGTLVLELAHFDARIEAVLEGEALAGTYRRTTASGLAEVPFRAGRRAPAPPRAPAGPGLTGDWAVDLGEGAGLERTAGILKQEAGVLTGTLRTTTGDYGPLHGTFDGKKLVLTVFDGVHVYRFDGELAADGTLAGEFRSRANPPVPWKARRLDAAEAARVLPDLVSLVKAKNADAAFSFVFPDEKGKTVDSKAFAGRPVVVTLMGTWCPNCNDEAPVLQDLFARYSGKGLAAVALAFEYTDDVERSRRQIARFRERYGVTYPVLLAGTTKNAREGSVIAQLDGFQGYPTTIYLDRAHRVVKIHSGFDGPATGPRFAELKKEMEGTIRHLLGLER